MLSGSKLSASDALVVSVLGQYSGIDVILNDRQAYDVTRLQLTRSLRKEPGSHPKGYLLTLRSGSSSYIISEGRSNPFQGPRLIRCIW